jgi:glycosyltransferase involved in cell wall biosynthesis
LRKIIHVITGLEVGGAERALYVLLTNGLEGPFQNEVISLTELGHYGPLLQASGIPVCCLGLRFSSQSFRKLLSLFSIIRSQKPDIIQGWMTHGNIAASLGFFLRRSSASLALNVRSSLDGIEGLSLRTRVLNRIGAIFSYSAHAVVYNSKRAARQYSEFGYKKSSICFIPNGFDTDFWKPSQEIKFLMRAKLGLSGTDRVIGFVGRADPAKNLPNLFSAFEAAAQVSTDVVLVAVGRDIGPIESKSGRIILTGQRNDVEDLMRAFDVFCLSSSVEGFPNVLGEAMATEVPCVTTDVGDAALIVSDTGWVVPPRDSQALAQALIEAIATPPDALRARGAAARMRIEAEFSITSVVARYISLYEHLIEERR